MKRWNCMWNTADKLEAPGVVFLQALNNHIKNALEFKSLDAS